jgi:hypothetical protein
MNEIDRLDGLLPVLSEIGDRYISGISASSEPLYLTIHWHCVRVDISRQALDAESAERLRVFALLSSIPFDIRTSPPNWTGCNRLVYRSARTRSDPLDRGVRAVSRPMLVRA